MTPEPQAPQAPFPPSPPSPSSGPSPVADQRRKRRNRLILFAFVYGLLIVEIVGSGRPSVAESALGGSVGVLVGLQLLQLVGLLLGRLGGTAPTLLVIGSGPLLAVRRLGQVTVLIRPIPLLPVQVLSNVVAVPALRVRLFLGGLLRIGVLVGLGAWLLAGASHFGAMVGMGFELVALLSLLSVKQRGSAAWMIFRVPTADRSVVTALALDPAEMAVQRAVMGARNGEARAALAGVTSDRLVAVRLRAAVDIAEGRYREALDALRLARVDADPAEPGGELLLARAALYGLEAGAIPHDEALAVAGAASAQAGGSMPRLYVMTEIPATEALLTGRAAEALALARTGARRSTDLQTRALTLCTLAAAQSVTGDQPAARATLARARALAPDLARLATVERLITELPLTRDRV
ncbi:hypothetical protein [Streptacidiphilus jiangxiensis]|uniref:Uncharacterized protein n=1 Tax=Streptacidiphilus jiangxiensis TaxID=235985 RepID=A0A1H7FPM8_STRJI|nr:hypothetical protein [Streptacidiphilus jiangxiensis]SEK27918.1 hypothetical protein SAMN05414137_101351 [Streptacidiphilus jiangxiensis]